MVLYVVSFILLSVGASVGFEIVAKQRTVLYPYPVLLFVLSSVSSLAMAGLFIWGFWGYSSWLPFVGIVAAVLIGGPIGRIVGCSGASPGWCIMNSIAGLLISVISVLGSD